MESQPKKLNIAVKKVNKKTSEIEWTKTLEIPYDKDQIEQERQFELERELAKLNESLVKNSTLNEQYTNEVGANSQTNEYVDRSKSTNFQNDNSKFNPFYQPSMNTIEFNCDDSVLIASIFSNDKSAISKDEELLVLEKLFENKIITEKEFTAKKQIILGKEI